MQMRKVNKTLSLPLDVVEQLEQEDDMSRLVAELLRKHYDTGDADV